MAEFSLSKKATSDLDDIADYTFETFGERQADKYASEPQGTFQLLAERSRMGKTVGNFAAGLRSYPFEAHVIYYLIQDDHVFIVRILHHSRDAKRHL